MTVLWRREINKDRKRKRLCGTCLNAVSYTHLDVYKRQIFEAAGERYSISPRLLRAVAKAESGFNPRARSGAGAMGVMQLMPATARSLGVTDPYDPWQNIMGGAKYLKEKLDQFGDVSLALAAYNAGPGAVRKYGGIPPYRETQDVYKRQGRYHGCGGRYCRRMSSVP